MVEIVDQDDGSIHRRHVDQIHISSSSAVHSSSPHDAQTSDFSRDCDIPCDSFSQSVPVSDFRQSVPSPRAPDIRIEATNSSESRNPSASDDVHLNPPSSPFPDVLDSSVSTPDRPISRDPHDVDIEHSIQRPKRNVKKPERFKDFVLN